MADQGGVSKIGANNAAPLPAQRAVDALPAAAKRANAPANQGAGRREVPDSASRQWVNIDGKQFSRTAPRGTYLNIVV
jgi:hypothetical protein